MKLNGDKKKNKIRSIFTSISSILILGAQYVPCTAIWRGFMSVPLVIYLSFFFQYPEILEYDIRYLFGSYGFDFTLFGFIFFIYSLIYQLSHRKQLIRTGPYKYLRHPQYLALIIMTFGMTLIVFRTSPIIYFEVNINRYSLIFLIWSGEVLSYIFLAKIEDYALKSKYGNEFLDYVNNVPFMFPFLKLNRNKPDEKAFYTAKKKND